MEKHGLKDHEIRELVNHITNGLVNKLSGYKLPQCLRTIIHDLVVNYLITHDLKLDK